MSNGRILFVSLIFGSLVVGCSGQHAVVPSSASTPSKLVGKTINVLWGGLFDFGSSPFFEVRDVDSATGMLCLSSTENPETSFWIHPSKLLAFSIATEKEIKEFTAQQAEVAAKEEQAAQEEQAEDGTRAETNE